MEDGFQGSHRCFNEWMNLQEQDLSELLQSLSLNDADGDDHTADLRELVDKNIRHFQEYASQRARLARNHVSPFFSPTWCTSLEGSMLWAGGCRPSIFVRLVYVLSGKELASHLDEYLHGGRSGGLGELSASQINSINSLQLRTIQQEDKLSANLASIQEEMADQPIFIIAKELAACSQTSTEADEALNALTASLIGVLGEADSLRLNTLKELTSILTPVQSVDFIATARKLHLCVHAWGRRRDREHGRH
ncbi:protein DELAY OF GERMINATION 1-like [Sesamum indicum]|uniref:Protein DELAY OF GERMINATION 1-like n=1 Tax=Sesamum indicum TaxID=4182 RepID=A0A6I9UPJ2_SESIN|nr:protein DELAY OF GERMINATION 1-like [Sesamum indicum]